MTVYQGCKNQHFSRQNIFPPVNQARGDDQESRNSKESQEPEGFKAIGWGKHVNIDPLEGADITEVPFNTRHPGYGVYEIEYQDQSDT